MDFREVWQAREQARREEYLAEMRPFVAWARTYWVGRQVWWQVLPNDRVCYGLVESIDDTGRVLVISGYDAQGQPRYDRRAVFELNQRIFLLSDESNEN